MPATWNGSKWSRDRPRFFMEATPLGGVVNAVSSHQEVHDQPHQGWRGQVSTVVGSANAQGGGSFNAEYGAGRWMVWAGGGGQRTGDYYSPRARCPLREPHQ